ncbi:MAG: hypothetical protein IT470_04460 [Pseudomonadales bacterium]|nr:hypothetical protein [Pseudomonadales bacterium]
MFYILSAVLVFVGVVQSYFGIRYFYMLNVTRMWALVDISVESSEIREHLDVIKYERIIKYEPVIKYMYIFNGVEYRSSACHFDKKSIWFDSKGMAESFIRGILENKMARINSKIPSEAYLAFGRVNHRFSHHIAMIIASCLLYGVVGGVWFFLR